MGLTHPPYWLSDFRGLKPLADRLWFGLQEESSAWRAGVTESSMFSELDLSEPNDEFVVASTYEVADGDRRASIEISSALVAPETASSLVRALQSIENDWDYRIPNEGDDAEIQEGAFHLEGWLGSSEGDRRLDEDDPLRRNVGDISAFPGASIRSALELQQHVKEEVEVEWSGKSGHVGFRYQAWSDVHPEHEDRSKSDYVRSSGHRLYASKALLQRYMKSKKMDLLIEIQESRRARETESNDFDDSKEAKDRFYDRVLVFRRDGSIEAAEGRVGAWSASSEDAKARGGRRHTRPVDGASPRSTTPSSKKGKGAGKASGG